MKLIYNIICVSLVALLMSCGAVPYETFESDNVTHGGVKNKVVSAEVSASKQVATIFLTGEFRNPGEYEYKEGMTLSDAVMQAGGLTDGGSKRSIRITRIIDGEELVGRIEMEDPVLPGDIVSAASVFF